MRTFVTDRQTDRQTDDSAGFIRLNQAAPINILAKPHFFSHPWDLDYPFSFLILCASDKKGAKR